MSRNGAGVYSLPAGSLVTNGQTSDASDLNTPLQDLETDMNTARPIVAGGTGATSASAARTALGLAIGTDVQAYDAELTAIAALAVTDGNVIVGNGTTWVAESGATARASLGLTIGTDVQAYDADLAAIAGLSRTRGDLIRGGAAAWERVALGTSGQVLTSDGTDAVWSAPSSGLTFLSTVDLANDAVADFTLTAGYDAYVFELQNVTPATDAVALWVRTSTDGGSTFDSGASDYAYSGIVFAADSTSVQEVSNADTKIATNDVGTSKYGVGSDVGEDGVSGQFVINGAHLVKTTQLRWHYSYLAPLPATTALNFSIGGGARLSVADVDAVRFLFSSGNLESGTITLWGMKNA